MIYKNGNEIIAIYKGTSRVIGSVYYGENLVWSIISSAFGSGIWINEKVWKNDDSWKN